MVSEMPSRVKDSNPPVTTKVNPARVCGICAVSCCTTVTPASLHFRIISRCQSTANHSTIDCAIVEPTPSTAANSSADDVEIFAIDAKLVANACAAVGPTCRIDSATNVLHSGCFFACSSAARSFVTFAPGVPSFLEKLTLCKLVLVEIKKI